MPVTGPNCSVKVVGILSRDNSDLVPNGVIPEVFDGTREVVSGTEVDEDGNPLIVEEDVITQLLPANQLGVEICFEADAPFNITPAIPIPTPIGGILSGVSSLTQNSLEDAESRGQFVYQICDSVNHFNEKIIITEEMLVQDGQIEFDLEDYPIGIIGVSTFELFIPSSEEDLLEIGSGFKKIELNNNIGLIEVDSIPSPIGSSQLFETIVFNDRARAFTGAAEANSPDGAIEFVTGGENDLTSKRIRLTEEAGNNLNVGDTLFITYSGASNRKVRHGIKTEIEYVIVVVLGFPVDTLPQSVKVQAWNYLPFNFKIHKDPESDRNLNTEDSNLVTVEAQRVVEYIPTEVGSISRIKSFIAMDDRGIMLISKDPSLGEEFGFHVETLIPATVIADQQWFNNYIEAHSSELFFTNRARGDSKTGLLKFDSENVLKIHLRGMLFDVSDHVNGVLTDFQKTPYVRDLALALQEIGPLGLGFPNIDLIINQVVGRSKFDASSAVFSPQPMSSIVGGSWQADILSALAVNNIVQGDAGLSIPFFFYDLSIDSRLYIESFVAFGDGSKGENKFFVRTNPSSIGDQISVASDKHKDLICLAFPGKDGKLSYRTMSDTTVLRSLSGLVEDKQQGHQQKNPTSLGSGQFDVVSYSQVFGSNPNHNFGKNLVIETGNDDFTFKNINLPESIKGLSNIEKIATIHHVEITKDNVNERRINLSNISNQRLRDIRIDFKPIEGFDENDNKLFHIVFDGSNLVVDNFSLVKNDTNKIQSLISNLGYYRGSQLLIKGSIFNNVEIIDITIGAVSEDIFQNISIDTKGVSVAYDFKNTLIIFYEDSRILQSTISCVASFDDGNSWLPFYDLVLNPNHKTIKNPYVIEESLVSTLHLFYLSDNQLFYKQVDGNYITAEGAFEEVIYSNDPESGGKEAIGIDPHGGDLRGVDLSLMSDRQQLLRTSKTSLVIDDLSSEEYAAFLDSRCIMYICYLKKGRMFVVKGHPGAGVWEDLFEKGLSIHQGGVDGSEEEFVPISKISIIYNGADDNIRLIYIVDKNIYLKIIPAIFFSSQNKGDFQSLILNSIKPLFIVGEDQQNIETGIGDDTNPVELLISPTAPDGYIGNIGFIRFFYRDDQGFIRSVFLDLFNKPILESRLKIR